MKKKLLPVLTVFCLVVLVLAAGVITFLIKKYTPSGEMMDGESYFQIQKNDEAALIVNRTVEEEKVKIIDGRYYVADTVVGKYINGRFYWDANQKLMLYTLPLEEFQIVPETQQFQTSQGMESVDYTILKQDGDSYYLDLEFVKAYTDMECAVYENPARVVIRTNWDAAQMVTASADCKLRQKGGIKSIIVDEAEKGEKLYLEEELEDWSRVSTEDGYSGYVEKKYLSAPEMVTSEHISVTPEYTSVRRDYKINMAWHQVTSVSGNATLQQVLATTQGLNTISPTWFSIVDNNGTISSLASADYVNQALREFSILFLPVINIIEIFFGKCRIIKKICRCFKKIRTSPVHPCRSLVGQSVGISRLLPFVDQTVMSTRRLSNEFELSKYPVCSISE